jgi:anti-anti-sigma regulatory factor
VVGRLDGEGLGRLESRLDELLDGDGRSLVADLSGVTGCDGRLFDLLARTSRLVGCRGGWLRLVGLGSPVLNALDQAALPEVLLVYRASEWASHGIG